MRGVVAALRARRRQIRIVLLALSDARCCNWHGTARAQATSHSYKMNFKMRFINIYSSVIMGPVGENDKELRFMSNWQRHVVYCGWMSRVWPRQRLDGVWGAVGLQWVRSLCHQVRLPALG